MLSRWRAMATRLASAVSVIAMMLMVLPQPVGAQSSDMKKLAPEPVLSIDFYRTLDEMVILGDKLAAEDMVWFMIGLRTTLMAANDAYVGAGAKRRVCIPPTVTPSELLGAVSAELERNEAYWEARKQESIVPLALLVFAKKWPCK
jgi:predicted cobalt transporter CbtA